MPLRSFFRSGISDFIIRSESRDGASFPALIYELIDVLDQHIPDSLSSISIFSRTTFFSLLIFCSDSFSSSFLYSLFG